MARRSTQIHAKVQELIPDKEQSDQVYAALRRYQSSQDVHRLLSDLRQVLDVPEKLELYEYIRPLVLPRNQMQYSYYAPSAPGVRLRTIRLHRVAGQSIGFAIRGGFEFGVGVFVSSVEGGSQAELRGLKAGDELVRVNGFVIAEAIHEDVLNLIKSREEIVLKVTHIGMIPVKEDATDPVTWRYAEDFDSKPPLEEVLRETTGRKGQRLELKIFIDASGSTSIGCGILSGPHSFPGIFVEKVRPGSLAEDVGLDVGDQIVEVNDTSFLNISHNEAVMVLKSSKQLNLVIRKKLGLALLEHRQNQSPGHSMNPTNSSQSQLVKQRGVSTSLPNKVISESFDQEHLIEEQLRRRLSGMGRPTPSVFSQQNGIETETTSFSYTKTPPDMAHSNGIPEEPSIPVEEGAWESPTVLHDSEDTVSSIQAQQLPDTSCSPDPYPATFPDTPSSNGSLKSQTSSKSDARRSLPVFRAPPPPSFPPPPLGSVAGTDLSPPQFCAIRDVSGWNNVGDEDFGELSIGKSEMVFLAGQNLHGDDQTSTISVNGDDVDASNLLRHVTIADTQDVEDDGTLVTPDGRIPLLQTGAQERANGLDETGVASRLFQDHMTNKHSEGSDSISFGNVQAKALEAVLKSKGFSAEGRSEEPVTGGSTEAAKLSNQVPEDVDLALKSESGKYDKPDIDGEEQRALAQSDKFQIHDSDLDLLPPPPPSLLQDADENLEPNSMIADGMLGPTFINSGISKHTDADMCSSSDAEGLNVPYKNDFDIYAKPLKRNPKNSMSTVHSPLYLSPTPSPVPVPGEPHATGLGGAAAVLAARREQSGLQTPRLLGPEATDVSCAVGFRHTDLLHLFTPSEIDGRELRSFVFPKSQDLKIAMEGGNGTPLAGRIVVAAVFDGGAAIENGLQTGDQLLMVGGKKLSNITLSQAEKILEDVKTSPQKMIHVVYAKSLFLNNEECVTYF